MPSLTGALALLCVIGPLSTDMYLPALPRMARELGTDASGAQLTLTAFLVGMTLGHLVFGPLSDRYGRRRPLLAGAVGCAGATALCAVAPTLEWLVAGRFAAGFGGAAGIVVGRAVVSDVAQGASAARLLALLMTLGAVAPVVAPLAGGAVAGALGWRGVFWALTAVASAVAVAVALGVPESLPPERRRAGGLRRLAASAREVARDRPYVGYTLAFAFSFGALFCYVAGSPFLFQNELGLGVGESAAAFGGGGAATAAAGAVGARLVVRVGARALLLTGVWALLAASVSLLLATVGGVLSTALCLALLGVACAGVGLAFANAAALAIGRVPGAAGVGSALLGTVQSAVGAGVAPLAGDEAGVTFGVMTVCAVTGLLGVGFGDAPPGPGAGFRAGARGRGGPQAPDGLGRAGRG
ncbi:Bcr/CflA family efflux MFS transporter [Streptomyces sp. NPDC020141]|uniref:Bcr/CflA family efflux MFS transporter n=1 Tax=Streptomyces sp. NPDC020141 TaxID=3365065 RepID=UPI0037AD95DC